MKTPIAIVATATFLLSNNPANAELILGSDLNYKPPSPEEMNDLLSTHEKSKTECAQSPLWGDHLRGTEYDDVINGGIGNDILFGYQGNDILIGGTKDSDPYNRDTAFGHEGDDILLWEPGDGDDFFDGGQGSDVLIVSRIGGLPDEHGNSPFIDTESGYPLVDLKTTPGYCEINSNIGLGTGDLNRDYQVKFNFRKRSNGSGESLHRDSDSKVSIQLENTEFVVCPSRDGVKVEIFDLRRSAISTAKASVLPAKAYRLVGRK